jgi:hypothetical protein
MFPKQYLRAQQFEMFDKRELDGVLQMRVKHAVLTRRNRIINMAESASKCVNALNFALYMQGISIGAGIAFFPFRSRFQHRSCLKMILLLNTRENVYNDIMIFHHVVMITT